MNADYARTVQLLLAVAPAIFSSPVFAMKGGTAINSARGDEHRAAMVGWAGRTADRPPCPGFLRFSQSPPVPLAAA